MPSPSGLGRGTANDGDVQWMYTRARYTIPSVLEGMLSDGPIRDRLQAGCVYW